MKTRILISAICLFLFYSCAKKNDAIPTPQKVVTETKIDSAYICFGPPSDIDVRTYTGTVCCIKGSEMIQPGDTAYYTYLSNIFTLTVLSDIISVNYNWKLYGDSMTIVSGLNTSIVGVKFSPNFNHGAINCIGGTPEGCGVSIVVSKK